MPLLPGALQAGRGARVTLGGASAAGDRPLPPEAPTAAESARLAGGAHPATGDAGGEDALVSAAVSDQTLGDGSPHGGTAAAAGVVSAATTKVATRGAGAAREGEGLARFASPAEADVAAVRDINNDNCNDDEDDDDDDDDHHDDELCYGIPFPPTTIATTARGVLSMIAQVNSMAAIIQPTEEGGMGDIPKSKGILSRLLRLKKTKEKV